MTLITDLWLCIDRRLTGRSGHRSGQRSSPVRSSFITGPVRSPVITGPVIVHHRSGPVTGQKKKSFIIIGLFFFFVKGLIIVNELPP
ncbi:hypothetical protein DPMN_055486 [Dreissena polymorpha]|uniref:Uncharacterized protein n=1 Tax=Dreissena polymorpha TaxID=45954 RepID=A0A9D4CQ27_DREPO|nr:hypothetical protein DPMN_055486 [Dreissena polymorpha]